ncbi:MAG: hypothetical protein QF733_09840, partial [Phycisphaerales bacterium]|nr:hypothetical protein [Phycisphaerales bacterium]
MLTSLLVCTGLLAPLEPQSGTGSMYIFTQLGTPPTEICQVARTTELSLEDMLAGGLDHEICIDGGTDAQSRIEGRIDVYDGGMKVDVNGWGEAVGSDVHDAFSRHDADFSMIISVTEPVRMRVDWYHHAVGLGGAWLRVQRLYDPDGTWNPGPDVIDRSVSSYIDAVLEDGVDVLYFQPGGWSFRAVTT